MNIVWDFDGTVLPMTPYDSEQTLLLYHLKKGKSSSILRKLFIRAIMYADMKGWLGHLFKPMYIRAIKGSDIRAVEIVASRLAKRISSDDIETFRELYSRGHELVLVSCGTLDLSKITFETAGISKYFSSIIANNFVVRDGRIESMEFRTLYPEDKLKIIEEMGYKPENTVVVGDGPTDIPLLEWSNFPVIIDRERKRAKRFRNKNYHVISKIAEILPLIRKFELVNLKR